MTKMEIITQIISSKFYANQQKLNTVEPRSTSLNRYQAELVLRFTRITKQFFALKLI